jgi:hypothetical protein
MASRFLNFGCLGLVMVIPMHLADYIELVDWSGRQIRPDKRSAISETAPPILARLGIEQGNWPKMAAGHSELPTMFWLVNS